jgi:restriction system protein
VGRERELQTISSFMIPKVNREAFRAVLVYGPAGVGKTALVQHFASRHREEFPGGILDFTGLNPINDPLTSIGAIVSNMSDHGRGLVVLDGAQRDDSLMVGVFVSELRKRRRETDFVLTSRAQLEVPPDWLRIRLENMGRAEFEALLRCHIASDESEIAALTNSVPSNPAVGLAVAELASRGESVDQMLVRLAPNTYSGVLGADGQPLSLGSASDLKATRQIRALSSDLLEHMRRNPALMRDLDSRRFEEFVAELYERHGFEVELTPATKDGGVDLYAVRYEPYGKLLTVVECKRHAVDRPVEVKLVRELYGAVQDHGASAGVLATTSSFTTGAQEFQERHRYRLALQDWFDLQDMLCQIR